MNKKKSKVLAFLLATAMIVPSANGTIYAATDLNDKTEVSVQENVGVGNESNNTEELNDEVASYNNKGYKTLQEAVEAAKTDTSESEKIITLSKDVTLDNTSNILVDKDKITILSNNGSKIYLDEMNSIKVKEEGYLKIKDLVIVINKSNMSCIQNQGATLEIEGCKVIAAENVTSNSNFISGWKEKPFNPDESNYKSKLILKNNDISINIRGLVSNVGNGSEIIGNTFDLKNEKVGNNGGRTGVLTVVANKEGSVKIIGNTFKNANRAIGVDNSSMNGENLIIKNNKFIDTRFAFEVGSNDSDNRNKTYDLSGNYYNHKDLGGVGLLRIEDASSNGSHFEENGNSTELKIGDKTPLNIVVGPYYTNENKDEIAHAGVATVNGKDYARLESAIKAAKDGDKVTLVSDINVETWNQIWNIKGITLDGNGKTIKVKKIESLENHDAVLHSVGGNTFKNLTIDLSEVEKGKAQGIRAIDAGNGDTIENVTIKGGANASYGITAGTDCKNLTVQNSSISNCGSGIYFEGTYAPETKISIKGNTFDGCEYASILYPTGVTFEENTVKGGKVNIMNDSTVVQKNTFTTDEKGNASRVKFYTEGNNKTFKYNKLLEGPNGKIGSTITFATASDTGKDAVNPGEVDLSLNYLGDKSKLGDIIKGASKEEISGIKDKVFAKPSDVDEYLNGGSNKPSIPSIPSKPIRPTYDHTSIIGSDRYETAGKIADELGSYDTAVLVNATSTMSDGLSAAGLAGKEDATILLVKKDSIPKATMDRLKKVKKVYIIGGENAISTKVANEITAAGVKVERIGGKTRVETSELVAKKLGNYKKAFVVNGFKGEADAMSASAVAAREEAPILLTNGKTSTHAKKSSVSYYVVGGNTVVDKSIATKYNAEVLDGDDRYETNREVINEFYGASETLYFANGETLVDALTASTIAKDDGLVLVGRKSDNKILNRKNTIQVGGMNFNVDFEK